MEREPLGAPWPKPSAGAINATANISEIPRRQVFIALALLETFPQVYEVCNWWSSPTILEFSYRHCPLVYGPRSLPERSIADSQV
jgi:hypothetical protein